MLWDKPALKQGRHMNVVWFMGSLVLVGCLLCLPLAVSAQSGTSATKIVGGQAVARSVVSQDLLRLHEEYQLHLQTSPSAGFQPSNSAIPLRNGRVVVDAVASEDAGTLLISLEALGLEHGAANGRMVSGDFPIEAISQLDGLNNLNSIRPAYAATGVGLVTSQGDSALHASLARTKFSVDGTGLVIGTLSDSYNCLGGAAGDVTNNDLAGGITVLEEISSCTNAKDEGRGMMQLIHDLAPGAGQAFHTGFNGQANFANGINDLANIANCDIICDDVFYFAEPFFQDGIIAQAVDNVVGMGIPYFALAGNHGRKSYEDVYRASGVNPVGGYIGGNAHDFDSGAGTDIYQRVTIPNGTGVTISFQWDQPFFSVSGAPGSANDLDILLYDNPPTTILAASATFSVGGDPVEVLNYTNNTGQTQFNIVLVQWVPGGGPAAGRVKYIALVNGGLTNFVPNEWDTQSSTVYGHMNSGLGETVGAAFYDNTPAYGVNPPVREAYSSSGRTVILFDTSGNPVNVLRDNPDIVAVDGTNTTFFGGDIADPGDGSDTDVFPNFFGTSAATPHAAAVAALLLDAVPGLTPAQVYSTLESTAIDMATAGWDEDTGFGLIQTDAAICDWDQTPPVITCPSDVTVECAAKCGVPAGDPQLTAFFGGVSATDLCDPSPTITNDAPTCFPKGTTTVTFTATDDKLNQSTCTAKVTVVDTTPPDISVTLNRDVLWPPNHKMADITASVTVTDICCESPTFVLTSIWSDEPENAKGDGNTSPDIMGADFGTVDTTFQLRSERMGGGDGRVYTIMYAATDCSGNAAYDTVYVRVPHDQSGHALACTGFRTIEVGVGLDPQLDEITLVVRSKPAEYGVDASGNNVLLSPAFDATTIDVAKAYVGNVMGVTVPSRCMLLDNNADGLKDVALFYSASAVNRVIQASAPLGGEDYLEATNSFGPIGLHYTNGSGIDYLVPDIFGLGAPVPLLPTLPFRRGGGGSTPSTPPDLAKTALLPSYPNPFNPTTTIPYSLETNEIVTLRIYDATGRLVRTLENGAKPAGPHAAVWDGRDARGEAAATGVYFVRFVAGSFETTQKIVLLK